MKNVLVYNIVQDKIRYEHELLLDYFRAQVDNSLRLGWKKEDIIIGTNFDFEHNGVKNIKLNNICTDNIFNNKWWGMLELMKGGHIDGSEVTDILAYDGDLHSYSSPRLYTDNTHGIEPSDLDNTCIISNLNSNLCDNSHISACLDPNLVYKSNLPVHAIILLVLYH